MFGEIPRIPNRLCSAAALAALLLLCAAPLAEAQSSLFRTLSPLSADTNGVHLYSISLYDGYYSSPQAFTMSGVTDGLKPDMGYGISAALGWNYLRSGSGISISYTPSYNGFRRYSNLNAVNHAFSLSIHNRHNPARKWRLDFGAAASATTTNQFLFEPNTLGQLADVPSSYDQLAEAIVAGRFSNDQIASILTGAAPPSSAAQIALFGDYYLSASLQQRISYAPTTRFSVTVQFAETRFQALPRSDRARRLSFLPNSTSGAGSFQISYSISPRTQIAFDLTSTRTVSRSQDVYTNQATVSLSRILSRRWFVQGRIGAGNMMPLRGNVFLRERPQPVGGGAIGFKTQTHTFMAQSYLARSDPYGVGALSTIGASGAWSWRPRVAGWSALATATWQQMRGSSVTLADSSNARVSVNRALTRSTGISLAFAYFSVSGPLGDPLSNRVLRSAVLSFYWSPGGERPPGPRSEHP